MQRRTWSSRTAIVAFVTACISSVSVLLAAPDPAAPAADLPQAATAAKSQFRPLTPADLEQSRMELLAALDRLDRRLTEAGENGNDWRKYLDWQKLASQLGADQQPDRATLTKLYEHFNADYEGLELVWFVDVQRALRHYIAMLGAVSNQAQVQQAYSATLDQLAKRLAAYEKKPSTEDARLINESLRFLQEAQQAPELVRAIQERYGRPNFFGRVSGRIVGAGIAEPVDDTGPVVDCILGTSIYGTARTIGQTTAGVTSNENIAAIGTLFSGVAHSQTTGYHRPVVICSTSVTNLCAQKMLFLDINGLSSCPATSQAQTDTCIHDIQSESGRRLVERIAWKRAGRQKEQAEWIASRHAEQRLNARVDDQAAEQLNRANQQYLEKVRRPLEERKLFSDDVHFSTNDRFLKVVALQASDGKIAAQSPPPAATEDADMSMAIHESAINNFTYDALAGRTVHEEKAQAAIVNLLGRLPERMKGDEDGKPWAITFDPRQPIAVTFADNGFKVIIRGARYYKGTDSYPAMNVSASYKITNTPQGIQLVRQGDIEVLPPDFKPGEQIDTRRQVIRTLLAKRFSKVFEPQFLAEGFELPGRWQAAGRLMPVEIIAQDGWLVISWKQTGAPAKAPPASQTAAR